MYSVGLSHVSSVISHQFTIAAMRPASRITTDQPVVRGRAVVFGLSNGVIYSDFE